MGSDCAGKQQQLSRLPFHNCPKAVPTTTLRGTVLNLLFLECISTSQGVLSQSIILQAGHGHQAFALVCHHASLP